jgi:hypothetical protein
MVIDREIVDYVGKVVDGPADDELDGLLSASLCAVREVAAGKGSFIEHETTLRHFRKLAWDPPLFSHLRLKTAAGAPRTPSLAERARLAAQQYIAAGDTILPEPDRRILETIYRRAAHL